MKKYYAVAGILLFFSMCIVWAWQLRPSVSMTETVSATIAGSTFSLEVADTPELQSRGLSFRNTLAPHTGMLFVFATPGRYRFWMKDMRFPIDIVWLDQNKRVVHIEHIVTPETYPAVFGPSSDTQYAIELGAGVVRMLGLSVGDRVDF